MCSETARTELGYHDCLVTSVQAKEQACTMS